MKVLLEKYERIDVLYSHNDAMTLGAISAMEEVGLIPGKDIIIITVDGEQAAIDLLREGKIVGDVTVQELEDAGEDLLSCIKKTYDYRGDRIRNAIESLTEEGER